MKKVVLIKLITICVLLFAIHPLFAQEPEIWRNPEIFAINKEAAHAEFVLLDDKEAALAPLDLENPWNNSNYKSLNGQWDFNWYGDITKVPEDWYKIETQVGKWDQIPVPGIWQNHGYDRLYYLNVRMPFEFDWETGKKVPGFREEKELEQSKETGYIPDGAQTIGCYRKWVTVPEERLSERVVLRIGAVEAGVKVYVNGEEVGYSQGSMTPAEFEISKYLSKGKNLIALKVYRWTDGSYMEVQDMIRFAGIYRDVFLRYEPKQRIKDIKFIGTPDASLKKANGVYNVTISNGSTKKCSKGKLSFEIFEVGSNNKVKFWTKDINKLAAGEEIKILGNIEINNVKLWSPDQPNLYTLVISLLDKKGETIQVTRSDIGFKRFEDINGNLHLNGKRYFIRGVNRHDHHAKYGKYVPLENMIRDLELMKQHNINTVRTSHYPNDERWYYLCNRYGMALIDEANIECHLFQDVPGNRMQWKAAAVDRVESVVQRDKNHPSVFIWSLGNEQGWGWTKIFDAQFDRAKELDDSRLVMCDRGNRKKKGYDDTRLDKPNTVSPMYGTLNKMRNYLKNRDKDKRPFFMCEYRHAMGNSVGSLKEVWDVVYKNEDNGLNGGCIWDWMDQGVEAHDTDGTVYYQYGGDWGDKVSEYNFCLNGLIMSDQSWTPKLAEVKKCYEPFAIEEVSVDKGEFKLLNRLNQTNLRNFIINWKLLENGVEVESGNIKELKANPFEKENIYLAYNKSLVKPGNDYVIRIGVVLKENQKWAKKGHEVTFSEFTLKNNFEYALLEAANAPTIYKGDNKIEITTENGIALVFNESTGLLTSFNVSGNELLAKTQREYLFDHDIAWIDNLFSMAKNRYRLERYFELELDKIERQGNAIVNVTKKNKHIELIIQNTFANKTGVGYVETQTWVINGNGQIALDELVEPTSEISADTWIPRIGLRIPFTPQLSQVSYYGLGPYGNYPDRNYGSWTAVHTSKVTDNYVPYPNPQDHGNRESVRWLSLTNSQGKGIKFVSQVPLSMSALPYTQDELLKAKHTIDLPKQSTTTEFRVAAKVTGIGNGSCGPVPEPNYKPKADRTGYSIMIVPIQ